jgi:signal peptidase II
MKRCREIVGYFALFFGVVCLDQLTKLWALRELMLRDIAVFPGLNFSLTFNRGVVFGFFSSKSPLYFWSITAIVVLALLLFFVYLGWMYKKGRNIVFEVLIAAGALSNIFDRFIYVGVVDFIDCYVGKWHWPNFNVADMFIVVGILGIVGREIFLGEGNES